MYELHLRHYDRAGVLQRSVLEPLWARYTDQVNDQQPLVFALNADDPQAASMAELDIFEVMLRNKVLGIQAVDGGFVRSYVGILRDWDMATNDYGVTAMEYRCAGENHILSWRSVLYPANVNNRSSFSGAAAETLYKTLAQYNLTIDASTANGRQRDGDLLAGMGYDITIAGDGGLGNPISAAFMGANVLSVMQKLAERAGGDFALRWQGGDAWEFDFYVGQLGQDKSSGSERVLFSLATDTMRGPRLKRFGARATSAAAAGQGEDDQRMIEVVTGPDYAADYDFEMFVDARNEKTAAGVNGCGEQKLEETRIREELTFGVLQTSRQFYSPVPVTGRKTYKAGDLVLVDYGGENVRKVESVTVNWKAPGSGDAFQVDVETREIVYAGS
jgi:hypothetical protein